MKRKLFAMVLAAAMSLSIGVMTAHGYADDKDIVNDEAVAVMSAVGVLKGTEDGTNFAPKDELDRASAAKIITYLAVGPTAAESMKTTDAPFDDVPTSHWAAGYIAYCKTSGIIAGDGSGKFNPSDKVKTNEFAKMLLTVLGYDAGIEGMTGAQWSVNVSKLASANDLYDKTTKGVGDNLVREEAAQLAFNTLLADTYEYESKGTQIDLGSGSVSIGATPVKAVANTKNDYRRSVGGGAGGDATMQLVEKLYGEKFKKVSAGIVDDFGRPGYRYTYDSKTVWNGSETNTLSYHKKISSKTSDISTDLKNAGINVSIAGNPTVYTLRNSNNTADVAAKLYLNGSEQATSTDLAALLALSNAPGKETEIFVEDGAVTTVAVTEYTVGKVDSVSELKDSKGNAYTQYSIVEESGAKKGDNVEGYVSATNGGAAGPATIKVFADSSNSDNNGVLHSEIKKGDVVTYVKVKDKAKDKDVYHVYGTTVVTGKQTAYNSSDAQSTINDKSYKWGTGVLGFDVNGAQVNSEDERNFYIDKNGYLVKCDEAKESSDYVFLADIAKLGTSGEGTLVFQDGTTQTAKITSLKKKGGDNEAKSLGENTAKYAGFYTYSKSGTEYKLTALDSDEFTAASDTTGFGRSLKISNGYNAGDAIIQKKKSDLAKGTFTITASTKVIVYDKDQVYTVYSGGLANMPTITKRDGASCNASIYCVMEKGADNKEASDKKAKLVFIDASSGDWDIEDSATKEYFYVYSKDAPTTSSVSGSTFYTYKVAEDGTTKTINVSSDAHDDMVSSGLKMFKVGRTDKNGNITSVSGVTSKKGVIAITENVGTTVSDVSSDTIVFSGPQGVDQISSVPVTSATVVTRIQDKEVNNGGLSSVGNYLKKDKVLALYVFYNGDGDAEKVYVVLDKD